MLRKYSGQNVMQASMYNLQSLLCFMFHCCVQLERRADFPDDEVDVLFREFEDSSGQGSPLSPLLGGTSGSRLVSVVRLLSIFPLARAWCRLKYCFLWRVV